MADETYYSVLEVSETASTAEIRAAYRRLISEVHPDRLANAPAYWQRKSEEKTKEINEAFGVLSNPEKRRLYDSYLRASRTFANDKATSERHSSPPPSRPNEPQSQASTGYQGSAGSSYRSAPPNPPRDQRTQASTGPANPATGTPRSSSRSKVTPNERAFFSVVLALFGFGSAVGFWEPNSGGEGVLFFVLAVVLLFALALLYQSRISQLLSRTRLRTPRHQLFATAGVIALLLFAGKIAYLPLNSASSHQVPAAAASASTTSPSPADSTTNSPTPPDDQWVPLVSLPTGTEIVKRRRNGGHGKFSVDNGTADDAVVALVDVDSKKAIRAFYVEAGKKYIEQQIGPGRYTIFYMTGLGWDASTRQFSRTGETGVFDQSATFAEQRNEETGEIDFKDFSITLHRVAGGTGHTSEVGAEEFKKVLVEDLQ